MRIFKILIVATVAVAISPSSALAARNATPAEQAALKQAAFDAIATSVAGKPGRWVYAFRISTKAAAQGRPYRTFAAVVVFNMRTRVFYTTLFGYYVGGLSGWKLLDAHGGCDAPAAAFAGRKAAVLADLELRC